MIHSKDNSTKDQICRTHTIKIINKYV